MISRDALLVVSDLHADRTGRSPATVSTAQRLPSSTIGGADHLKGWVSEFSSAKKRMEAAGLLPRWIVCCGDLSNRDQGEELPQSISFLAQLGRVFGLVDQRIVVCPGNHDVDYRRVPDGDGVAEFYRLAGSFITPRTEPFVGDPGGFAPLCLDSTDLIGRSLISIIPDPEETLRALLPWPLRLFSTRIATAARRAYADQAKITAAAVPAKVIEQRLPAFIDYVRRPSATSQVPVVIVHHPIFAPATHTTDSDTNTGVVHAALFKGRLFEHDVALVLQGHVHEAVVHKEQVVAGKHAGASVLVITLPSLAQNEAFAIISLLQPESGSVQRINGYLLDRRALSSGDFYKPWFAHRLVKADAPRCTTVRRVLRIDQQGQSRVDHYFHEYSCVGPQRLVVPLYLGDGRLIQAPVVARLDSRRTEKFAWETRDSKVSVSVPQTPDTSFVLRVEALGCHALSLEDSRRLRGTGCKEDIESTTFSLPVAADRYELMIRFPSEKAVPDAGDVWVSALAVDPFIARGRPPELCGQEANLLRGAGAEDASVSAWNKGRRVIVTITNPLPDVPYVVCWRLPPRDADSTSSTERLRTALTKATSPGNRGPERPEVLGWPELPAALVKLDAQVLKTVGLLLAQHLALPLVPDETSLAEGGLEVSFQVSDHPTTPSGAVHPALIRTITAVAPPEFASRDRYRHAFRFGHGLVGIAIRSGSIVTLQPGATTSPGSYEIIQDGGPPHDFLTCVPLTLEGCRQAFAAVCIGVYNGVPVPPVLRSQWQLCHRIDSALARVNSHLAKSTHGNGFRLKLCGPPAAELEE